VQSASHKARLLVKYYFSFSDSGLYVTEPAKVFGEVSVTRIFLRNFEYWIYNLKVEDSKFRWEMDANDWDDEERRMAGFFHA